MACCAGSNDKDAQYKMSELLGTVGLREIAQQTQDANRVMGESFRYLEKADRAAVLGYPEGVVAHYRSAGERANRMCRRQFGIIIGAIDERMSRDDWPDLNTSMRHEYDTRGGRELFEDARAEFRARLLDMDTLPSSTTGIIINLTDEALDRADADGLNGGMQLLRDHLENALSALAAPEMGRQQVSPDRAMVAACLAGVVAVGIIAMIICAAAYLCWCCYFIAILVATLVAEGACAGLEVVHLVRWPC